MLTELLGVCLALVMAVVLVQVTARRRRPGEPPLEPGPLPYFGVALEFSRGPLRFLTSRWRKYGDVFTVRLAGHYTTFVMDPHSTSLIFRERVLHFHEHAGHIIHLAFGAPADYYDSSPRRVKIRTAEFALFRREIQGEGLDRVSVVVMGNLQSAILAATDITLEWNTGGLWAFVYRTMFLATFQTLFGRRNEDETPLLLHAMEEFQKYDENFREVIGNVPWYFLGKAKKRREYLRSLVNPAKLGQRDVSDLIRIRHEIYSDENVPYEDMASHNFGFFWASLNNTAPAAFWTLYYLLKDADAMAAVRAEVDAALEETGQRLENVKKGGKVIHVTRQQLNGLKCLGSAINEALRMSTSATIVRVATEDAELSLQSGSTFRIRKGDRVALYPQALHMDPEIFQDPETYKHDRFLENGKEKTTFYKNGRKLRHYLLPFGHGANMCVGRFFALNEIKQFITIMVGYYHVELLEQQTPPQDQSRAGIGTLSPGKDCLFRYRLK